MVISDSQLEHRFDYVHALDEMVRVLRVGGRLVMLLPNIAHWRVRLWLLSGRFPYLQNTPTDELHLRFFTLPDIGALLAERSLRIVRTDGSASLWVEGLYPRFFAAVATPPGPIPGWRGHRPSLFARDFIVVAEKVAPAHDGDGRGRR